MRTNAICYGFVESTIFSFTGLLIVDQCGHFCGLWSDNSTVQGANSNFHQLESVLVSEKRDEDQTVSTLRSSFVLMIKVVNESISEDRTESTAQFTRRFFNRSFDLETSKLVMDKNGDRLLNVLIRQLNQTSGDILVRWSFIPQKQLTQSTYTLIYINGGCTHPCFLTFSPYCCIHLSRTTWVHLEKT